MGRHFWVLVYAVDAQSVAATLPASPEGSRSMPPRSKCKDFAISRDTLTSLQGAWVAGRIFHLEMTSCNSITADVGSHLPPTFADWRQAPPKQHIRPILFRLPSKLSTSSNEGKAL